MLIYYSLMLKVSKLNLYIRHHILLVYSYKQHDRCAWNITLSISFPPIQKCNLHLKHSHMCRLHLDIVWSTHQEKLIFWTRWRIVVTAYYKPSFRKIVYLLERKKGELVIRKQIQNTVLIVLLQFCIKGYAMKLTCYRGFVVLNRWSHDW